MQGGDLSKLDKGLALDAATVKDNGYKLGDTFTLTLPTGSVTLPLVAIYTGIQGSFEGWVTSNAVVDRLDASPQDSQLYVLADKGTDGATVAAAIQARSRTTTRISRSRTAAPTSSRSATRSTSCST